MTPKIEQDDIIIRRAANGWIVFTSSLWGEDEFKMLVYEEEDSEMGAEKAFIRMMREMFPDMVQSKKRGGVSLQAKDYGYAYEEESDL